MSENIKNTVCTVCGAALSDDGVCSVCGHREETSASEDIVKSTEASAPEDIAKSEEPSESEDITKSEETSASEDIAKSEETSSPDDIEKSAKAETIADTPEESVQSKHIADDFSLLGNVSVADAPRTFGQKIVNFCSKRILVRVIALAVSLILLAFVFTPFVSYKIEMGGGATYNVSFSPKDSVELAMNYGSLFLSKLTNKPVEGLGEALTFDENSAKQSFMSMAMLRLTGLRITVIVAAIATVIYVLLCALAALLAIKALISELVMRKKGIFKLKRYAADGLICMIACFLPVMFFCFMQAFDFGTTILSEYGCKGLGTSMAWGAILTVAVSLLGGIFVCASSFFKLTEDEEKPLTKLRITRMVCCVLMILMVVSIFLPCNTISIWHENGDTDTYFVDVMDIKEMPVSDLKAYRATAIHYGTAIVDNLEKGQVGNMQTDDVGETLFHTVMICRIDPRIIYGAVIAVTIITLLFVGSLLWSTIRHCFFEIPKFGGMKAIKLFTTMAIAAYLIMMIVLNVAVMLCLRLDLSYTVGFSIGIGAVLAPVFMVAILIIRQKSVKKVITRNVEYDNADVSYAPYVLGK